MATPRNKGGVSLWRAWRWPALTSAPLLLLSLVVGPPVAQAATLEELDSIVAVVNKDVIVRSELEREIVLALPEMREKGAEMPARAELERKVLERMIEKRLQMQEAQRVGIKVEDGALTQAMEGIAQRNNLTLEELQTALGASGIRFEDFREDTRAQMIMSQLQAREVIKNITVTDPEIKRFLARESDSLIERTDVRLSHILVAVPETASGEEQEQARKKAQAIVAKLRAGADFGQLARAESQGQQTQEGGDLGWFTMADVPSLAQEVSRSLAKGEVSNPLRSPSGFHIIQVTDIKGSGPAVISQTKARHILIRTNEVVSDDDARIRLEQLRMRLVGGDDFANLARANSDDTGSALKGGDLGWLSPGDTVPQFEAAMSELAPNQISQPFKSSFGWHIVQVNERRSQDTTEELMQLKAKQKLRERKADEAVKQWLRKLRDEAYIEDRLAKAAEQG
ncbi:MAG: peptidylprolyl isomerase [Chromatiaceae bacterium]|nr:peptidylprolyl isomerase [Chromatiaceae bacterium]